jgi:hypothetical protein
MVPAGVAALAGDLPHSHNCTDTLPRYLLPQVRGGGRAICPEIWTGKPAVGDACARTAYGLSIRIRGKQKSDLSGERIHYVVRADDRPV